MVKGILGTLFFFVIHVDLAHGSNIRQLDDGSVECLQTFAESQEGGDYYGERRCEYLGHSCVKGIYVIYPNWRSGNYSPETHEQIECATSQQLPALCPHETFPGAGFPEPRFPTQTCGYETSDDGKIFMTKFLCLEVLRNGPPSYSYYCPLNKYRKYFYFTNVTK
jgi:hypothetical protein